MKYNYKIPSKNLPFLLLILPPLNTPSKLPQPKYLNEESQLEHPL